LSAASLLQQSDPRAIGLKFDVNAVLEPETKAKTGKLLTPFSTPTNRTCLAIIGAHYKQPGLHIRGNVNAFNGPTFTPDVVIGRDGFFLGGEATYDIRDGLIKGYNAALGFAGPDYT
jgi:voltage-dependent anion channel protein 2